MMVFRMMFLPAAALLLAGDSENTALARVLSAVGEGAEGLGATVSYEEGLRAAKAERQKEAKADAEKTCDSVEGALGKAHELVGQYKEAADAKKKAWSAEKDEGRKAQLLVQMKDMKQLHTGAKALADAVQELGTQAAAAVEEDNYDDANELEEQKSAKLAELKTHLDRMRTGMGMDEYIWNF